MAGEGGSGKKRDASCIPGALKLGVLQLEFSARADEQGRGRCMEGFFAHGVIRQGLGHRSEAVGIQLRLVVDPVMDLHRLLGSRGIGHRDQSRLFWLGCHRGGAAGHQLGFRDSLGSSGKFHFPQGSVSYASPVVQAGGLANVEQSSIFGREGFPEGLFALVGLTGEEDGLDWLVRWVLTLLDFAEAGDLGGEALGRDGWHGDTGETARAGLLSSRSAKPGWLLMLLVLVQTALVWKVGGHSVQALLPQRRINSFYTDPPKVLAE